MTPSPFGHSPLATDPQPAAAGSPLTKGEIFTKGEMATRKKLFPFVKGKPLKGVRGLQLKWVCS